MPAPLWPEAPWLPLTYDETLTHPGDGPPVLAGTTRAPDPPRLTVAHPLPDDPAAPAGQVARLRQEAFAALLARYPRQEEP